MIDQHKIQNQCACKKCGSLRFRHEQIYEMHNITNSNYDISYELLTPQEALICVDCGTVYDMSQAGRLVGVFKKKV